MIINTIYNNKKEWTLVWENGNDNIDFSAQTIFNETKMNELKNTGYKELYIVCKYQGNQSATEDDMYPSGLLPLTLPHQTIVVTGLRGAYPNWRSFSINNNKLVCSSGITRSFGSADGANIPSKIYAR